MFLISHSPKPLCFLSNTSAIFFLYKTLFQFRFVKNLKKMSEARSDIPLSEYVHLSSPLVSVSCY